MPLVLDTPQTINATVNTYKINSYAVDLDRAEMYLVYSELNTLGDVIAEKSLTIVQPDFTSTIGAIQANINSGMDFYTAQKNVFYDIVKTRTNITGTVS